MIGDAIRDGRYDVAHALVVAVLGGWHDHPPYTDLAQEIVDDPYCGIAMVFKERDHQLAKEIRKTISNFSKEPKEPQKPKR
jgi:hypothetical protein